MLRSTARLSFRMASCAPFTRAVVSSMRKLYPEHWADKSFDNTGLLLEAPFDANRRQKNSVLLTIDLTKAVADEAIERKDSIVVTYHPIIFHALKSLTLANTQQQSLLRLAAAGISVYSPHTAVDAAPGGLGDFLADLVTGTLPNDSTADESDQVEENTPKDDDDAPSEPSARTPYVLRHFPSHLSTRKQALKLGSQPHTRTAIQPYEHTPGAGMGRIVRFTHPQPLEAILTRVRAGLDNPTAFPLAIPQGKQVRDMHISSVGICPGSGGSLLGGLDVDLLFTGELVHHETLAAVESGRCVLALFHSNSERAFLRRVLQAQLAGVLETEWRDLREHEEERVEEGLDEAYLEALRDETVRVDVSTADRDPFGIYMLDPSARR